MGQGVYHLVAARGRMACPLGARVVNAGLVS